MAMASGECRIVGSVGSCVVLAIAGTAAASMGRPALALLLLACGCLITVVLARRVSGGYDSFAAAFVGMFTLYGLSGPLNALMGRAGLSAIPTEPYRTAEFLVWLGLALAGLAIGLALFGQWRRTGAPSRGEANIGSGRPLLFSALVLAALAGCFELVNFLRAGGWDVLLRGKAAYQSAVAELALTLPSQIVSFFAFAAMALFLAQARSTGKSIAPLRLAEIGVFLCLMSPLLMTTAILTRRTEIGAWIFIGVVGLCWRTRLRRISAALMMALVLGYLGSVALLAARADLPSFRFGFLGDPAWWEKFGIFLNPGVGEFGAPFAVSSEFLTKSAEQPPRLGRTYLEGVSSAVPGFLWPGQKPQPVDMEIRDRLFPSYTRGATLESPGFSAILEARLNFGEAGIFGMFLLFGLAAAAFELLRRMGLPGAILYLTLLPIAQTFHRSAFGPAVISVATMSLAVLVLFCLIYYPIAWWLGRKTIRTG